MSRLFTITVPSTHRPSFQNNSNVIAPGPDKDMDCGIVGGGGGGDSEKPRKMSGPHVVEYGSLNKQRKLKVLIVNNYVRT